MKFKLPSIEQAIRDFESKKLEVESAQDELSSLNKAMKFGSTTEQRSRRNELEVIVKKLKQQLLSANYTIAEVQYMGEGALI